MHQIDEKREGYSSFSKKHWGFLLLFFIGSLFLVELNASDFKVSVITSNTAPAYDGMALPIKTAPKWTSLDSSQWNLEYSQIPSEKMQPLPTYNPSDLTIPTESLGWSTAHDLAIRNEKITFSVPYMGNYKLDGKEYAGSHLAVDIKVPRDTPVYSIGNGVVVKVSEQSSGFGHHIVIKHDNFPSFSNSSDKETYYSSYSHLNKVLIAEGAVILKGQQIGKSGSTGTSTTPHLHFQIDNSKAPWHPYWPFTFQEATDAGLTFTGAVNAGLGKEKAMNTTINPMLYVQQYLSTVEVVNATDNLPQTTNEDDANAGNDSNNDTTVENNDDSKSDLPPVVEVSETKSVNDENPPEENSSIQEIPAVKFEVSSADVFTVDNPIKVIVTAIDEDGDTVKGYYPNHDLYVKVLAGGADVPKKVKSTDFLNGVVELSITPTSDIGLKIKVTDNEISGESHVMHGLMFTDIDDDAEYLKAVKFLKKNNVISGYPDGTFKPDKVVSRVESLKFILKGMNSNLISGNKLPFPDTKGRQWYSDYVATAYNKHIVEGYPDNTFKPENTVNRAEFLKMLLTAMEIKVPEVVTRDVYKDVKRDDWYAPYVKYAKEKNLLVLKKGGLFKPEEGMTRAEVSELIYRVILLKVSGMHKYSSGINVSTGDVQKFYS